MKYSLPVLGLGAALLAACGDAAPADPPEPLFGSAEIEFPVELWDQEREGETLLMVLVNAMGGVDSVYVAESSGHAAFDSAAVAGARELRFAPARKGERRVEMWARLPVRFARDGATFEKAAPNADGADLDGTQPEEERS